MNAQGQCFPDPSNEEFAMSASKTFVSNASSLLSIVIAAMLGGTENSADSSPRANAVVAQLYEPLLRRHTPVRCDVKSRFPEGEVPAVDFETMYRPMPANRIHATNRTIAAGEGPTEV
jgi:hypothetical protein